MYRVLRTSSKTLICSDEVVYASPTATNLDSRFVDTAIQVAEERFVKPLICKDFYEDFRNQKNKVVTSINQAYLQTLLPTGSDTLKVGQILNSIDFVTNSWYVEFWNELLWKFISECVIYTASPMNYSRFSAQGEMLNQPQSPLEGQSAASVDLGTMKWKLDRIMQDRISPLTAQIEQWLYDNKSYFILLNCKKWSFDTAENSSNNDGVALQRKTAWITGIYSDSNYDKRCCD